MTQKTLSNTVINLRDLYILSLTTDGSITEYLFIPEDIYIANSERLDQLKLNVKRGASRKYFNNLVTTKSPQNSVLHCIVECEFARFNLLKKYF